MDPAGLRPLGIGETIDVAIKIYRARFRVLVTTVAVVLAPVFAVSALIRVSFPAGDELFDESQPGTTPGFDFDQFWPFLAGTVLIGVLTYLASQLATGACFKAISGAYLGEEADWRSSLRFGQSKLGSLLWLSFLVGVCAVAVLLICLLPGIWLLSVVGVFGVPALFLGLLPGIYLWVAWSVAAPVLLLDDARGWQAMKRSRALVTGRFWATIGVLLLVAILTTIVQALLGGLLVGLVSVSGNAVALALAEAIGQTASAVLTTPLSAAVLTVLYFDLRVRKEGFDLELLSRRMGVDPPPGTSAPESPPPQWPAPPDPLAPDG